MFKKKIKISVFTDFIQIGGGPMGYTYNMINGLKKIDNKKFKIRFIGFNYSLFPKTKGIVELVRKVQRRLFRYSVIIQRKLQLFQSDICIFQGWQDCKMEARAKKNHKICVYMPHSPSIMADEHKMNWELTSEAPYDMMLYKRNYDNEQSLFEMADYIVFPSKNASTAYLAEWKNIIEQKKVVYIKSGTIDRKTDASFPIRDKFPNKKIFAFIGRYVTHKGFDVFCNIAERFKDNDDVVFVSAGSGPLESLAEKNNVHNLGFIADIGGLIKNIDCLIIPNKIAYYDLLPIECAAYGKPMIFSYVGGNIDQVSEFTDSLYFTSENLDDLYSKIKKAIVEIENNKTWGEKNRVVYYNDFTDSEMMKRWLNFFETIA